MNLCQSIDTSNMFWLSFSTDDVWLLNILKW
jgi:hypothetical protein